MSRVIYNCFKKLLQLTDQCWTRTMTFCRLRGAKVLSVSVALFTFWLARCHYFCVVFTTVRNCSLYSSTTLMRTGASKGPKKIWWTTYKLFMSLVTICFITLALFPAFHDSRLFSRRLGLISSLKVTFKNNFYVVANHIVILISSWYFTVCWQFEQSKGIIAFAE